MRWAAIGMVLAGLVGMAPFLVAEAPAQSPGRIGYVDVLRVFAKSAAGTAAREQVEREKGAMQKELDGKQTEINKLREELDKKGMLLSAEARKEKQDALERKLRDARRLIDDYQRELEKRDQELQRKFFLEVAGVVERYGKQHGYQMIVERRAGVLYGSPEADVTDEIIKAYDQETSRVKK
jgi:outer membrane protein